MTNGCTVIVSYCDPSNTWWRLLSDAAGTLWVQRLKDVAFRSSYNRWIDIVSLAESKSLLGDQIDYHRALSVLRAAVDKHIEIEARKSTGDLEAPPLGPRTVPVLTLCDELEAVSTTQPDAMMAITAKLREAHALIQTMTQALEATLSLVPEAAIVQLDDEAYGRLRGLLDSVQPRVLAFASIEVP